MDKNGQNRGGARKGAGRPKKSKTVESVINLAPDEFRDIKGFMSSPQKGGYELLAMPAYGEIKSWLRKNELLDLVPDQLIAMYAMSLARWIQIEERLSGRGFQTKHPTTGALMASQFIRISMDYQKQTRECWQQIAALIKTKEDGKMLEEPSNSLIDMLRSRREA